MGLISTIVGVTGATNIQFPPSGSVISSITTNLTPALTSGVKSLVVNYSNGGVNQTITYNFDVRGTNNDFLIERVNSIVNSNLFNAQTITPDQFNTIMSALRPSLTNNLTAATLINALSPIISSSLFTFPPGTMFAIEQDYQNQPFDRVSSYSLIIKLFANGSSTSITQLVIPVLVRPSATSLVTNFETQFNDSNPNLIPTINNAVLTRAEYANLRNEIAGLNAYDAKIRIYVFIQELVNLKILTSFANMNFEGLEITVSSLPITLPNGSFTINFSITSGTLVSNYSVTSSVLMTEAETINDIQLGLSNQNISYANYSSFASA
jgi:hypothetical protein